MIEASDSVFPNNAVELIKDRFQLYDEDLYVTSRPLRSTDPNQSIGIFGRLWVPNEDSFEMRGRPPGADLATLNRYVLTIMAFVKDMDEERGLKAQSVISAVVRSMLYHDEPLRVGLTELRSTLMGRTERLMRWRVNNQRFDSNELSGNWLYLSTLEMWLETETI